MHRTRTDPVEAELCSVGDLTAISGSGTSHVFFCSSTRREATFSSPHCVCLFVCLLRCIRTNASRLYILPSNFLFNLQIIDVIDGSAALMSLQRVTDRYVWRDVLSRSELRLDLVLMEADGL